MGAVANKGGAGGTGCPLAGQYPAGRRGRCSSRPACRASACRRWAPALAGLHPSRCPRLHLHHLTRLGLLAGHSLSHREVEPDHCPELMCQHRLWQQSWLQVRRRALHRQEGSPCTATNFDNSAAQHKQKNWTAQCSQANAVLLARGRRPSSPLPIIQG